jgi:hypothetical protein
MRFPLSHYLGRSTDSPTLWAFTKLAASLGVSTAALFASLTAVLLACVAAWVAWQPRSRAPVALAVVLVSQAVIAATAAAWTADTSRQARSALPANVSWVDDARVGNVTLVGLPGNNAGAGIEESLWNSSITRVVRMPRAERFDPGQVLDAEITQQGAFVTKNGLVSGPVLIDRSGTWISLAGARLARSTVGTNAAPFDLWAPTGGPVRIVADAVGLRGDGWLDRAGSITVWPAKVARRLSLRVTLPDARAATDTIHFTGPNLSASYAIDPKQTRVVSFIVPASTKPWTVRWLCDRYGFRNGSKVSFLAAPPRLTAVSGPLG